MTTLRIGWLVAALALWLPINVGTVFAASSLKTIEIRQINPDGDFKTATCVGETCQLVIHVASIDGHHQQSVIIDVHSESQQTLELYFHVAGGNLNDADASYIQLDENGYGRDKIFLFNASPTPNGPAIKSPLATSPTNGPFAELQVTVTPAK